MTLQPFPWDFLRFELRRIHDGKVLDWGKKRSTPNGAICHRAWLLRRGKGEIRVGEQRVTFGAGEWLIPGRNQSWQDFSANAHLLSVHFYAQWPDGGFLYDVGPGLKFRSRNHPELEPASLRLLASFESKPDSGASRSLPCPLPAHLRLKQAFFDWMAVFSGIMEQEGVSPSQPRHMDERVSEGVRWLNHFPLNEKFREQMLADHLGVSVTQMNRLFSRDLKLSPVLYLDQRRWERAEHDLQYTFRSAKEIAYSLGFCSPSYFTAWIRMRSGKTPKEFRRGL